MVKIANHPRGTIDAQKLSGGVANRQQGTSLSSDSVRGPASGLRNISAGLLPSQLFSNAAIAASWCRLIAVGRRGVWRSCGRSPTSGSGAAASRSLGGLARAMAQEYIPDSKLSYAEGNAALRVLAAAPDCGPRSRVIGCLDECIFKCIDI